MVWDHAGGPPSVHETGGPGRSRKLPSDTRVCQLGTADKRQQAARQQRVAHGGSGGAVAAWQRRHAHGDGRQWRGKGPAAASSVWQGRQWRGSGGNGVASGGSS